MGFFLASAIAPPGPGMLIFTDGSAIRFRFAIARNASKECPWSLAPRQHGDENTIAKEKMMVQRSGSVEPSDPQNRIT